MKKTIKGKVIASKVQTGGDEELPEGGGLPDEWGTTPAATGTPIFDALMAEKFRGHNLVNQ